MSAPPLRIGLVGYGYWGPNLARVVSDVSETELVAVCDEREEMLGIARRRFPWIQTVKNIGVLLREVDLDAVIIATPVSTHAPLAIQALEAGKHVLVTKPLAGDATSAREIVRAAERADRVLLVDHTFAYTGAVQKVAEIVKSGDLGEPYYFDSVRVNLGLFQHDVSVLWDLAVHDLSILQQWIKEKPIAVGCQAAAHFDEHPSNIAYLTLRYDSGFIAHIHVNWLSPVKVRKTLLGGSKRMVVYDDLEAAEKIKLYDRGVLRREDLMGSNRIPMAYRRAGDVWSPQVDLTEALQTELHHFLNCIRNKETPRTDGHAALQLVHLLEAAEISIRNSGALVPVSDET